VFGDHIQGSAKEPVKGADQAFKELRSLYQAVVTSRPFNLSKELRPPLEDGGHHRENMFRGYGSLAHVRQPALLSPSRGAPFEKRSAGVQQREIKRRRHALGLVEENDF